MGDDCFGRNAMLKGCYVVTADCARSGWGVVMRRLPMRGGRFGIRERDSISLLAGVVVIELCDTLPYGDVYVR